jgi:hypothetical protein
MYFLKNFPLGGCFELAKQALYRLSHTSSTFWSGYSEDRVLQTICLGWPQTMILLISASRVDRVTGMSHQRPAFFPFL